LPGMPQVVEFQIEGEPISILPRDADRLAERLRGVGSADCQGAADKIEQATRLGENLTVKLAVGEDECVLGALKQLGATGDFLNPLKRLERALQGRIEQEL